jgi:2-dehydro-3-deoxygluconokinase
MRPVPRPSVRAIGEAMVEMAPVGGGLYRRGFAGDTFNTAWHMARWLGDRAEVGMITRVGQDRLSDAFVAGMVEDGLTVASVSRDPSRPMGLYMIELDGVERSFQYWRHTSAARRLADDGAALALALDGVGLAHLSGITLAILPPEAREILFSVLASYRGRGGVVSFDPNIRPRLWASLAEIRDTVTRMLAVCDLALPSLDDERAHFGDADAEAVVARMARLGVGEVVVKDGAGPVTVCDQGVVTVFPTPRLTSIVDTTGAGDGFNAGYLAARVTGCDVATCVSAGQRMAAAVLAHYGALAPREVVATLPSLGMHD